MRDNAIIEQLIYNYNMMLYIYFNEYEGQDKIVIKKRFNHFYLHIYDIINDDYSVPKVYSTYENAISNIFYIIRKELSLKEEQGNKLKLATKAVSKSFFNDNFNDISNSYAKLFRKIFNNLFDVNKYFEVILLNGSYGSLDYQFGWSDIDIFCVIKSEVIHDEKQLINLRKKIIPIVEDIYLFNIYQLHGLFISSSLVFNYHLQRSLPIDCIKNGVFLTDNKEIKLNHIISNKESNLRYLEYDIVNTLIKFSSIKQLLVMDKINILHAIFSFPFAFLQIVKGNYYKKDSFEVINEFSYVFDNIKEDYLYWNQFYYNWPRNINLATLKNRNIKLKNNYDNIQQINKEMINEEIISNKYIDDFFSLDETKIYLTRIKDNMKKGLEYAKKQSI